MKRAPRFCTEMVSGARAPCLAATSTGLRFGAAWAATGAAFVGKGFFVVVATATTLATAALRNAAGLGPAAAVEAPVFTEVNGAASIGLAGAGLSATAVVGLATSTGKGFAGSTATGFAGTAASGFA